MAGACRCSGRLLCFGALLGWGAGVLGPSRVCPSGVLGARAGVWWASTGLARGWSSLLGRDVGRGLGICSVETPAGLSPGFLWRP